MRLKIKIYLTLTKLSIHRSFQRLRLRVLLLALKDIYLTFYYIFTVKYLVR